MQRLVYALSPFACALLCLPSDASAPAQAGWKNRLVFESLDGVDLESLSANFGWSPAGNTFGLGHHSIASDELGAPLEDVMLALGVTPGLSSVEVDGRARAPEACDLFDPYSVQQCTIGFLDGSSGEGKFTSQAWIEELGIPQVQAQATGYPQLVAVIDSGIDLGHPAFAGRLASSGWDFVLDRADAWDVPNGIDEDGDGYVDEAFGHGTHVASLITLIDPNALLLPYRVVDADGRGWAFDVARAVVQATLDGADVINLSLSVAPESSSLRSAIEFALFCGVDVYSSAGNTGASDVLFPASLEKQDLPWYLKWTAPHGVVAVTAVDADDVLADFSASGKDVDLAAPGVDLYGAMPGGMWGWWSGTSMSTAVASGSASLVRSTSYYSFFVPADYLLVATSTDIEAGQGSGSSNLKYGRIDVAAAAAANFIP